MPEGPNFVTGNASWQCGYAEPNGGAAEFGATLRQEAEVADGWGGSNAAASNGNRGPLVASQFQGGYEDASNYHYGSEDDAQFASGSAASSANGNGRGRSDAASYGGYGSYGGGDYRSSASEEYNFGNQGFGNSSASRGTGAGALSQMSSLPTASEMLGANNNGGGRGRGRQSGSESSSDAFSTLRTGSELRGGQTLAPVRPNPAVDPAEAGTTLGSFTSAARTDTYFQDTNAAFHQGFQNAQDERFGTMKEAETIAEHTVRIARETIGQSPLDAQYEAQVRGKIGDILTQAKQAAKAELGQG